VSPLDRRPAATACGAFRRTKTLRSAKKARTERTESGFYHKGVDAPARQGFGDGTGIRGLTFHRIRHGHMPSSRTTMRRRGCGRRINRWSRERFYDAALHNAPGFVRWDAAGEASGRYAARGGVLSCSREGANLMRGQRTAGTVQSHRCRRRSSRLKNRQRGFFYWTFLICPS
jgi:hypothetical protein